jgi:hypothetical protein
MTYRKVANEQTGEPELKCIKVMDEDKQQQQSSGYSPQRRVPRSSATRSPRPAPDRREHKQPSPASHEAGLRSIVTLRTPNNFARLLVGDCTLVGSKNSRESQQVV